MYVSFIGTNNSLELDFELELGLGGNNRHHCQVAVAWFMD